MNVYRLSHIGPDDQTIVSWHASRADAKAEAKLIGVCTILDNVEIPTTKVALIGWLNDNCSRG